MKAGISDHIVHSDRMWQGTLKVHLALSDKQEWATVGSRPLHATMISTAEAPSMPVDREFTFTTRDFARVRTLIYDRAGRLIASVVQEGLMRHAAPKPKA